MAGKLSSVFLKIKIQDQLPRLSASPYMIHA